MIKLMTVDAPWEFVFLTTPTIPDRRSVEQAFSQKGAVSQFKVQKNRLGSIDRHFLYRKGKPLQDLRKAAAARNAQRKDHARVSQDSFVSKSCKPTEALRQWQSWLTTHRIPQICFLSYPLTSNRTAGKSGRSNKPDHVDPWPEDCIENVVTNKPLYLDLPLQLHVGPKQH